VFEWFYKFKLRNIFNFKCFLLEPIPAFHYNPDASGIFRKQQHCACKGASPEVSGVALYRQVFQSFRNGGFFAVIGAGNCDLELCVVVQRRFQIRIVFYFYKKK
jgi:hypothetical protein